MNEVASAILAASSTSSSLASGLPYSTLSRIDPGNKVVFCETKPIAPLRDERVSVLTSCPSSFTEPLMGSWKRRRSLTNVVFPEPVEPTRPTVAPAGISREISFSTDSLSG